MKSDLLLTALRRVGSVQTSRAALAAGLCLAASTASLAQVVRHEIPQASGSLVVLVEGEMAEKVMLLTGLSAIERDMMLGMLFMQDGLTSTVGSHFTHPRKETWPGIKDGLAAAGVADFEALLVTLETETNQEAVTAAFLAVNTAVAEAQSILQPSEKDQLAAMVAGVEAAHARFNAAGPTDVVNYQDGWAGLMIERGKLDLLMSSSDPAISKAAGEMAMAMDDVILSMPDPAITEPVAFDPSPVAALLGQLQGMSGSI